VLVHHKRALYELKSLHLCKNKFITIEKLNCHTNPFYRQAKYELKENNSRNLKAASFQLLVLIAHLS